MKEKNETERHVGFLTYQRRMVRKAMVLDKIIAWHERMQLQGEGIAHELDRMNWMLENPDKDYDDYPWNILGEWIGEESE
tara:strand:+ start:1290 stop:1529 length:240 start_codon:yes stop_codon:yes gene_type:complete